MRKALFPTIIIIGALLLIARIFYLQIIDDSFKLKSDNNAIKIKYDYPERGYIYDRNGKLLVANQPSYDIMVIPRDVKKIDTAEFCDLLQITKEDFIKKIEKAKERTALIASGDLSHVLKPEGPYGYDPAGPKLDEIIVGAVKEKNVDMLLNIDPEILEHGAECGLRSILFLFGVFEIIDFSTKILSYEAPFGVGYMVALFYKKEG